uniref:pentapeptide repeat-containing protein n=1 Tax=uncultured Anaerococcus sp. TaxID=293428 RepID=UPI002639B3CA
MKEKLNILTYTLTYLVKIDFKYISLVLIKSVLFGIMPVINLKLTQVLIDSLTRGQEIEFIKILILISVFTCLSDLVGFSIKKIEDYSLLEINKFINIDIHCRQCKFKQGACFLGAKLVNNEAATFINTTFYKKADFVNTTFLKNVYFIDVVFKEEVNFQQANFESA